MGNCSICTTTTISQSICRRCEIRLTRRLAWLNRIGMPALQAVAYHQVNLKCGADRVARTTADSTPPVNEPALDLYRDTEQWLQHLGGRIGLKPIGHDRWEQPVSVHDWTWLIPHLIACGRILALADIADQYATLTDLCERINAMITHPEEKRLIGVCPTCLPNERTPILATDEQKYAVCPTCAAFLTLRDVRAAYLTAAGVMHITRTQSGAAAWIRDNLRVHVTGRDLMNARQQGRIHPRHIEGRYWEWDLNDLLAIANHKQAKEHQ